MTAAAFRATLCRSFSRFRFLRPRIRAPRQSPKAKRMGACDAQHSLASIPCRPEPGPPLPTLSPLRRSGRFPGFERREAARITRLVCDGFATERFYSTTSALAVGLGARLESIKCESSA